MEWYNKSTEETIKQVQVTEYITESDRLERQQKYGKNKMEEKIKHQNGKNSYLISMMR